MEKKMSPISFFSLHLEMMLEGKKIGNGTGFIYQGDDTEKKFLVTNYHVITASSPRDPSSILNGYPDCPDEICFTTLKRDDFTPVKGGISLKKQDETVWLEHRDRDKGVDIIALPIEFPPDCIVVTQNQLGLVEDINFGVGSDLFIVGFPYGYSAGDFFPIWKRGTAASEPLFKPEGLPRFYIDSYTKPGMSGAPVFASEDRDLVFLGKKEASLLNDVDNGKRSALSVLQNIDPELFKAPTRKKLFQLVGIYSGRIMPNEEKDPNIGIVWHKRLIDELFSDPHPTEHPYAHE